ncbi:winged helix-turn-helix domain-containing protein [Haloarchaeobius litoreus]|uniref:Helix-turn-helix domain-containing protein n=1 Tax=Haloarchaeobius litoreus TaxID=755306 RepID=A0ABD6DMR7_9EURY|nr:helix-turn-helix domain-containing protein [Haloarchaeobius litoreus]
MDGEQPDDTADGVDERPPNDVFGLLGNEVRVDILRALGMRPNDRLSFSALFDRVDIADSGNFNYHLDRLCGVFVRKTDDGDDSGYELTHAGREVVGAMYAGTYTTNATIDPIRPGWNCLLCDGEMVVRYADERAEFRCVDCDGGAEFSFPPGNIDQYDREELPTAFARWYHQTFGSLFDGFCQLCSGRVERDLLWLPGGGPGEEPKPSMAEFECGRCGSVARVSGGTMATFHPVVEGFLAEHGFDASARHPSQVWADLDGFRAEIHSEDPPRFSVHFTVDGERASVEIGPDASIESVRREPVE